MELIVKVDEAGINTIVDTLTNGVFIACHDAIEEIGTMQVDTIKQTFGTGALAPNKETRIAEKGSNSPLLDTGSMRESIYPVNKSYNTKFTSQARTSDWKLPYHMMGYITSPFSKYPFELVVDRNPVNVNFEEINSKAVEIVLNNLENKLGNL